MTEAEWLACEDPQPMLEYIGNKASDRKLRLFAVACCRQVQHLLVDKQSRVAINVAERYAEGLASNEELARADRAVLDLGNADDSDCEANLARATTAYVASRGALMAASFTLLYSVDQPSNSRDWSRQKSDLIQRRALLNDIVGNPFHPARIDLTYLTPPVTNLAQAIYDDRTFDRLPILADALEDAGCTNQDILAHCRGGGEHVLGCWVVDLLLAKQ